jgi:hypothetical protein
LAGGKFVFAIITQRPVTTGDHYAARVVKGMIVIAPSNAPQIAIPKPPPTSAPPQHDWIDQRILDLVHESQPVKLWPVLNRVSEQLSPRSRAEGREVRLRLWQKVRRLIGLGLIFRVGRNSIATVKPTTKPASSRVRRRRRTVTESTTATAVSTVIPPSPSELAYREVPFDSQLIVESPPTITPVKEAGENKSASTPELVTNAARALAKLPRRPKRIWSGFIGSTRSFCGMPILLSTGEPMFVFGVLRGRVVYSRESGVLTDSIDGAGIHWGVVPAEHVKIVRNPNAILLGRRKRGTHERPSLLKIAASRRNASMPARRGRRGRPPRYQVSAPEIAPGQKESHELLQLRSLASSP